MSQFQKENEASFLFKLVDKLSEDYASLQLAVSDKYRVIYGADVIPSPDQFAFLRKEFKSDDVCGACFGVSQAANRLLFSEQYLDGSIDSIISSMKAKEVDRSDIVEVGSLVSCQSPGAGGKLVEMIPWLVWSLGYEYVLITATQQLRSIFESAQIPFESINNADPRSLNLDSKNIWGSYYSTDPITGIIDVKLAIFESMKREYCEKFKVNLFDFVINQKQARGDRG